MNKLQGKDFINIGIFTVIYFVVIFAVAMMGFIPIFVPLISVFVPLVGGIPHALLFQNREVRYDDNQRLAAGHTYAADRYGLLVHFHRPDLWPDCRLYAEIFRL
ncbi:MAG TPA: MptD family putative ECF transporter S component [Arachidicoccus sp.]